MTTIKEYNPHQVYFRHDEVLFNGKTYICCPPTGHSCIDQCPVGSRCWIRKITPEEQLAEVHEIRCRNFQDYELLRPILRSIEWDEHFLKAVKKEILRRSLQ